MKKVLLLIAVILGTSVMVNAQTEPAKTTPAKEMKTTKHAKHKAKKAAKAAKMETATEKK